MVTTVKANSHVRQLIGHLTTMVASLPLTNSTLCPHIGVPGEEPPLTWGEEIHHHAHNAHVIPRKEGSQAISQRRRSENTKRLTVRGGLTLCPHPATGKDAVMAYASTKSRSIERLFDLSTEMLGTASLDGFFTLLNPAWAESLGWSLENLMDSPFISFVHPDDVEATVQAAEHLATPGTDPIVGFENRYRTSTGSYLAVEWNVVSADGVLYFVAHDVTTQRAEGEQLRMQEQGLSEARAFVSGLMDNMAEGMFAVNDSGQLTYLNASAEKLLGWEELDLLGQPIHETIHFEHLDGSAFPANECPILKTRAAGELLRIDRDVFIRRDGTRLPVTYSSSPLQSEGEGGAVVVFSDITDQLSDELRIERELDKLSWVGRVQDALTQDRFVLYAQPIMDLKKEEIVQHELLIRMKDPDGAIVLPGRFLPAAEEFGLILNVDRWVVEQSALLASAGHKVEFNLSAKSMGLGMVATIADAIAATGAPPENMICEITETAVMSASEAGEAFVRGLRDLGCTIALDDFGIGYGGLAYLKRLPVSYLKIDMQFVADLVTEETSRHVVRAIVNLARGFGAQTVAEGAENGETVDILRDLGVDFVQGYFIAGPRPVEEILAIADPTRSS
jgi:PAS domain S-box-containing protein